MRFTSGQFAVCLALAATSLAVPPRALPPIRVNDNRAPAGRMVHGALSLSLVIAAGDWRPLGAGRAGTPMLVFGEAGKPLLDPGPLLRVPRGTTVTVRVHNAASRTVVVHGLASHRTGSNDSLVLAAGATADAHFTADVAGTWYYWGSAHGEDFEHRVLDDAHLNGALIVDPPGAAAGRDRVFVVERHSVDTLPDGTGDHTYDLFTINGRPWPFTERLSYALGDSIHWRVINASNDVHPLHLHGFYFRVDAFGDFASDTLYPRDQQRHAVTEPLWDGNTMDMSWKADRPGGWIFHCHLNFHVVSNSAMPPDTEPQRLRVQHILNGDGAMSAADHAESAMGGLVLGIYVRPPAGWRPNTGPRRTLRLLVEPDSMPGDSAMHYAYVLDDAGRRTRGDSAGNVGPPIVLHRGEPTTIWIVNHTAEMTQVHWHGLEIESRVDGVVGISGIPGAMEPAIMPADSYAVLVTPPRAGSFLYHTHINDIYQQTHGLYGPLIVVDSGTTWNPDSDRVFLVGNSPALQVVLNGGAMRQPIDLGVGVPYRFRLMNLTVGNPALRFVLTAGDTVLTWTPLAKDGYAMPRRPAVAARQPVNIGETFDFEVVARQPRTATLEVRAATGKVLTRQVIRFVR